MPRWAGFSGGRAAARTPPRAGVDAGATGVDLQRVGEHDENHNGEASDCGSSSRRIHAYNIALDVVAIAQIAGDAREDVQDAAAADGREDDGGGAEVAVVCDFVKDREHVLVACVGKNHDREGGEGADGAGPLEDSDCTARGDGVAFDVVRDDEDDEVGNGEEGDYRRVFE